MTIVGCWLLAVCLLLTISDVQCVVSSAKRAKARARREQMLMNMKPMPMKGTINHDVIDEEVDSLESIKQRILESAYFDAVGKYQGKAGYTDASFPPDYPNDPEFCKRKRYRKSTLKAIREAPFLGLFNDLMNITQFEGSSITYAKGAFWVVFDSLRAIGKIGIQFQFRGSDNLLIPEDAGEAESQFEGLQYMSSTDTFLAVRESLDHVTHGLVPITEEIKINENENDWTLISVCPVKFYGLEDANKGWEGIHYYEKDGQRYLMGLCESNYCKTILGDDPPGLRRGNGRLIVTRWEGPSAHSNHSDDCHWVVLKEINLPPHAYFLDYAGIAFYPDPFGSRVVVVSQEDAAVWVGQFDWEAMEFIQGGKVYHFPRNDLCHKVYCNVEGLTWLDHQRLLFASDRSKPTQDFECMGRDQSVHIMAVP